MTMMAMTRTTAMTMMATCPMPSSCSLLMGMLSVPLLSVSVLTTLGSVVVAACGCLGVVLGRVVWGGAAVVGWGWGWGSAVTGLAVGGGETPAKQRGGKKDRFVKTTGPFSVIP